MCAAATCANPGITFNRGLEHKSSLPVHITAIAQVIY